MSSKILGLDPGTTTGWALIDVEKTIEFISWGETKDLELIDIADEIQSADWLVYEEWITDTKHAQRGAFNQNKMPAARAIGSAKTIWRLAKKPMSQLVTQYNHQKPVAYGLAGMKYLKGKQGMHKQDALAHAVYCAVRKLQALPVSKDSA